MIFSLVNHKKFGPGVIVSKDGPINKIYFKDGEIRNILNDSQFYIDEKITLDEFIRNELYEGIFDKQTKFKAKDYINKEHINIIPRK